MSQTTTLFADQIAKTKDEIARNIAYAEADKYYIGNYGTATENVTDKKLE